MKLVKDLGMMFTTERSTQKMPFALYECPQCNKVFKQNKYSAKRNKSGVCQSCCTTNGNTKHGLKDHRLYGVWKAERTRCNNPKVISYKNYGGRGIKFSSEFDDFSVWVRYVESLDNAYKETYTLDRVNNDGNYERGNLRWASPSKQCENRRLLSTNKTGEKCICLLKDGKYLLQMQIEGKQKKMGKFTTLEEAVKVRNGIRTKQSIQV